MQKVFLSVFALAPTAAVAALQPAAKQDVGALQGAWRGVGGEYSRERIAPQEADMIRLVFKDETLTMDIGKEVLKSTYKLDPSKKPKAIDLTSVDGKTKGRTYLGIYERHGDSLKICFSEFEQKRPAEFAAEGKPGIRTLFLLEREKK